MQSDLTHKPTLQQCFFIFFGKMWWKFKLHNYLKYNCNHLLFNIATVIELNWTNIELTDLSWILTPLSTVELLNGWLTLK